ncbi:MAG: ABC transporter ATP-binding protein [Anaerolineales bacterium]|nr:ABC transporter ATP-binding protein [Anaerolineales bacterium]
MKSILKLIKYVRPYWLHLAGAGIALLIILGAQLAFPTIIREVVDTGLIKGEVKFMLQAGLIILGLGVIQAGFAALGRYLSETVSMRFAYDLRNTLFNQIQHQSFSYHDHAQTGQLMSRCTEDLRSLQAFFGRGLIELLQVILLIIGSVILMVRENPPLTLITMLPMIPLLILTTDFGGRVTQLFYAIDRALGDLSSRLQENVIGVQVVRAFTREGYEINRFETSNRALYDARVHVITEWSKIMPTTMMLVSLSTILLLWFGGNMVLDGKLTVGQVVEFNSYMLLIAMPARQLTWFINMAGEAEAGARRISEVLDHNPEIASAANAISAEGIKGEVEFKEVSFTYLGETEPALENINFTASPNQTIGLIGHTGAGKTTLVNLIGRFYEAQQGQVLVDGIEVQQYELQSLRRKIGYVLQSTLLFTSSIAENISFGRPDASMEEIVAAAKAAQADDFINSFPRGYDTIVGERGITLSGGQRQRVAIARALLIDPRILVLDDSTSSVDTETEHLIQQALARLMVDRTTFIIAQRISSIRNADQILVFDQGRIVEQGRHDELIKQNSFYAEIFTLQHDQQTQAHLEMKRIISDNAGGPENE